MAKKKAKKRNMPGDAPEYLILTEGKTHLSEIGDWSYPTVDASGAWQPGDWKTYDLASSENEFMEGFDVTTKPVERLELGCDIFLAEGRGATSRHRDLVTYDAVRLLRPAPEMKPDWYQRVEDYVQWLQDVPWMESPPGVQHEPNAIIVTGPSINEAHARALQAAATLTVDGRPAANAIDDVIGEVSTWSREHIKGKITAGLVNSNHNATSGMAGRAFRQALADYQATEEDDWWGDSATDAVSELIDPLRPVLRLQLYLNVAGAHLSCPDELRQKVARYFAVWSSGYALLGDFDDRLVIYGVDRALPRATKKLRIPDLSGERPWLEVDE